MFGKKYIRFDKVSVRGRQVEIRFSCSKRLEKYLSADTFYMEYDVAVDDVSRGLLAVPAVSAFVPLAWATGADIYVEEMDETFLRSLEDVKAVMRRWHPSFSFATEVVAAEVVHNEFHGKNYGLLFSGGLDSVVSYIRNRGLKPHLLSIWGLDVLTERRALWKRVEMALSEFAEREGVPIHFIKSNARQLFNEPLLSVEFGESWWVRVSHGLTTIGLCAPLVAEGIGTVLIASTRSFQHVGEVRYPLGSSPLVDNRISWADVKVIHDSYDLNRQQKIKHVLKPFTETEYHPLLRVCTDPMQTLNCGRCRKCLNTIVGLVLEGIDPNRCGFKVNGETLTFLKRSFLEREFVVFEHDFVAPEFIWRTDEWKEIQAEIPSSLDFDDCGSERFFSWLRDFDLVKYGMEMERRMSTKRVMAVLKYRLLGVALTILPLFPETVVSLAKRIFATLSSSGMK